MSSRAESEAADAHGAASNGAKGATSVVVGAEGSASVARRASSRSNASEAPASTRLRALLGKLAVLVYSVGYLLLGALGLTAGSAALGVYVYVHLRGRNRSDVGVPMWEYGGLACVAVLVVYLGLVTAAWRLTRPLERAVPVWVCVVAWCARAAVTMVFLFALAIGY